MKSNIDNKSPRPASHLRTKAKKNALMEERFAQIETENVLLLEKMSHNARHNKGGIDCTNRSLPYSHSLSRERRKRELARITRENRQILRRIREARPTYDHARWEEEAARSRDVLQNICEFKPPAAAAAAAARRAGGARGEDDSVFDYMDFCDSIPE